MEVNGQFRDPSILTRGVIPSVSRFSRVGRKINFNGPPPLIETMPSSGTKLTVVHNRCRNFGALYRKNEVNNRPFTWCWRRSLLYKTY